MKSVAANQSSEIKKVWLTFDDGPHPEYTGQILDTLAEYRIKASFFVLGSCVSQTGTALLERMVRDGHLIGNHAYSHRDLTTLTECEIRAEIGLTEGMLSGLPQRARVFRPPYGATNAMVNQIALELGYRTVLWNVDCRDWDPAWQPDLWVERAASEVGKRERAVVLAHDIHQTTADHLAKLIGRLGNVTFACIGES